ncbi:amine sulfotransferase-like [Lissotriton helveticus]
MMSATTNDPGSRGFVLDESKSGIEKYKGFNFVASMFVREHVDSLEEFEIRDEDVLIAGYPKSGNIFTQQVMSLIYNEGHRKGTENIKNMERVPWIEYVLKNVDYAKSPSPRLFSTNLPYFWVPKDLRRKRGKVIYITRNPKDVLTSFYHFEKMMPSQTQSTNFEHFMEKFLSGEVFAGSWFEHVRGWVTQKENFNFLAISYEDMVKDLRSVVMKICQFVGRQLSDHEIDIVVQKSEFKNMKSDPNANYEFMDVKIVDKQRGNFVRKGTIGDWKNLMTVAQSERFDKLYQEKMKDLPIKFIWDINEDK